MAEIASANWKSDKLVNTRGDDKKGKLQRDVIQLCYWVPRWKSTERSVKKKHKKQYFVALHLKKSYKTFEYMQLDSNTAFTKKYKLNN